MPGNPSNAYPPIPTVPFLPPIPLPFSFFLVFVVVLVTAESINPCWICVSLSTANEPSPRSSNVPRHRVETLNPGQFGSSNTRGSILSSSRRS